MCLAWDSQQEKNMLLFCLIFGVQKRAGIQQLCWKWRTTRLSCLPHNLKLEGISLQFFWENQNIILFWIPSGQIWSSVPAVTAAPTLPEVRALCAALEEQSLEGWLKDSKKLRCCGWTVRLCDKSCPAHLPRNTESDGWGRPNNTLPQLLQGLSQEASAYQRPISTSPEEHGGITAGGNPS